MTHRMVNLEHAVDSMSVRSRAIAAHVLATSEQPLLRALAGELSAANAIEAARLAEIETELIRAQIADSESANLPEPPAYGA